MLKRFMSSSVRQRCHAAWRPTQAVATLGLLLSAVLVVPTAQAASCKLPKSYYKNVTCTASRGYFLASKDFGAPVALIDSKGKRVVDLSRYQRVDANKIAGGLIPVQRNSRIGYVNMQGREVVPAIYDRLDGGSWARPVADDRIVVKKEGNYGVITTANQVVVPFSASISDIDDYQNGRARVRRGQAISWLDKSGKVIADPNASSDNTALNNNANTDMQAGASSAASSAPRPALTPFTTLQPHQQDGRWGFIDENNVTMITYSFDEVRPFSEGLAGVSIDDKWGFVNLGGELVIPFRFDDNSVVKTDRYKGVPTFTFKEGKAWIGNLQNGTQMCIDKEGTNVACD